MASGFTKYIPITEDEYRKFREQQNAQLQRAQQEFQRPPALIPFSEAQNEQTHTLFAPTTKPDLQEQRYTQLFHIVNTLKKKVEDQMNTAQQKEQRIKFDAQPVGKAKSLLEALGDIWSPEGELMDGSKPVPNSNIKALMHFATSDWRTKYSKNQPKGAQQFINMLKDKNISSDMLGRGIRREMTKEPIQGIATVKSKHLISKIPVRKLDSALETGERVLKDPKMYSKFMKRR